MPVKSAKLKKSAEKDLLGALANKIRLNILFALLNGERNVGELADMFGVQQALISHNLKRLKASRFIRARRRGYFTYYSLNRDFAEPFLQVVDPTLRKNMREGLRLRAIFTQIPMVVLAYDTDGVITFVSGDTAPRFGLTAQQMLGSSLFQMFRDHKDIIVHDRQALAGEAMHWSTKVRGRTFDVKSVPYKNEKGLIIGAISVTYEVSHRAKAEELLRKTVAEWRSLAEGSPDLIATIDRKGTFIQVNREIEGLTREQVIGTVLYDYLPIHIRKAVGAQLRQAFSSGKEKHFFAPGMGQFNALGMFECRIVPQKNRRKAIAVTFTARSVSKKKRWTGRG